MVRHSEGASSIASDRRSSESVTGSELCCRTYSTAVLCQTTGTYCMSQLYCVNQQAHTLCHMSQLYCANQQADTPSHSCTVSTNRHTLQVTAVLFQPTGTHSKSQLYCANQQAHTACHNCTVPTNRYTPCHMSQLYCAKQQAHTPCHMSQLYCANKQAHTTCYMSQLYCANQ